MEKRKKTEMSMFRTNAQNLILLDLRYHAIPLIYIRFQGHVEGAKGFGSNETIFVITRHGVRDIITNSDSASALIERG